ncbi:hypothetical protein D3C73_908620 [compost metagenome]
MPGAGIVGNPLEVKIKADQTNELYAAKILLQYDPKYFKVQSVTSEIAVNQGFFNWKDMNGQLTLVATKTGGGHFQDGDTLAHVVLVPKGEIGSTALSILKESELVKSDADLTGQIYHPNETVTRSYEILQYEIEDVNQNGMINEIDIIEVAKRIGKPAGEFKQYDVNRDGTIDIKDMALIALIILK